MRNVPTSSCDPSFLLCFFVLLQKKKKYVVAIQSNSTGRTGRHHKPHAVHSTGYIALRLTLSGRSSGAEYTCYQSGHIPNHSTIADQLLPRKLPRSTNLSYSTLHLAVSSQKAPSHILRSFLVAIPFIPSSLPRPSVRILSRRDRAPAPPRS